MKSELSKEWRYALRSGQLLILCASFLFFALATPLLLKLVLPQVLSSRSLGEAIPDLSGLLSLTQLDCMRTYLGDVFEIGVIIIAFTLCGLTASEIKDNTWVLPLTAGKRLATMVMAKLLVFGLALILIPLLALLADYVYSGLLCGFEIGVLPVIYSGLLQGSYMFFLLPCLLMWGALVKKPIAAGFLTLATAYGIHFISSLLGWQQWTPAGLLLAAQQLSPVATTAILLPLLATILFSLLLLAVTLMQLKRLEWNGRKGG